jgi:hypothetical protein
MQRSLAGLWIGLAIVVNVNAFLMELRNLHNCCFQQSARIQHHETRHIHDTASMSDCFLSSLPSSSSSSLSSSKSTDNRVARKRALYSFTEARKIARTYGFTKEEFLDYDCPGAYQLPKNPQEVWKEEWKGWEDFLGTCLTFDEGRRVARSLGDVNSKEEYLELFREKKLSDHDIASRLPYRPDLKYKGKWISWQDFLQS